MDNITKLVGTRIRGFRKEKRLSQEELAEKCSLHPTYIGQLFVNITSSGAKAVDYIPDRIMYLVAELSPKEQRIVYDLIIQALKLRN